MQSGAADAELGRSFRDVPPVGAQRFYDAAAFRGFVSFNERRPARGARHGIVALFRNARLALNRALMRLRHHRVALVGPRSVARIIEELLRQMLHRDKFFGRMQRQDEPDDVAQFADVAGPGIAFEKTENFLGKGYVGGAGRYFIANDEGNKRCQIGAFPQARNNNLSAANAVIEILAEMTLGDQLGKIAVRRTNNPHIHGHGFRAAERRYRAFFEHAQQMSLQLKRHIADFVEEERAAVACNNLARAPALDAAGERARRIAKQFAGQKGRGNSCTVDSDIRFAGALALGMNSAGQGVLTNAGFT